MTIEIKQCCATCGYAKTIRGWADDNKPYNCSDGEGHNSAERCNSYFLRPGLREAITVVSDPLADGAVEEAAEKSLWDRVDEIAARLDKIDEWICDATGGFPKLAAAIAGLGEIADLQNRVKALEDCSLCSYQSCRHRQGKE